MKRALLPMLLLACAGPQKAKPTDRFDLAAAQRVTAALERMPTCEPGVDVGALELGGACTLMQCTPTVTDNAMSMLPVCCNSCSWDAALVNARGVKTRLDAARVREVFDLGDTSYECEFRKWRELLSHDAFSLSGIACKAPLTPDVTAAAGVKKVVARLPKCQAGTDVGRLVIKPTMCTRMFCNRACCNQCGWEAKFEGMSGDSQPVDSARVKELLKLGDSSLDCEVKAWAAAVENESISLEQSCVVR